MQATRSQSNIICGQCFTISISLEGTVSLFGTLEPTNSDSGLTEECIISPKVIPNLRIIKSLDCGFGHVVCLDNSGFIFTFGNNVFGKLGIGKDEETLSFTMEPQKVDIPPIRQLSCGRDFTICVSENNELFSFGCGHHGELGISDIGASFNYPKKLKI